MRKETTPKKKRKITKGKLGIGVALMVSGTLSGIWLGHMTSPDSDNPKTAEIYLATYGEWEHEGPISDGPFCQRGRLTLRAGSHTCTYATGDASVTTSYQSPLELARSSFPNRDFSEDSEKLFALVAPPVEGGLLFTILGDAETGVEVVTREERIILTAASLGAGGAAYYCIHKSEPDFDNKTFELMSWSRI